MVQTSVDRIRIKNRYKKCFSKGIGSIRRDCSSFKNADHIFFLQLSRSRIFDNFWYGQKGLHVEVWSASSVILYGEDTWSETKTYLPVWLGTIRGAPTSICDWGISNERWWSLTWDNGILGPGPRELSLTWDCKPIAC